MSESEIVTTLRGIVAVFDELGIAYQIGGSVASSAYGKARSTMDVDLVASVSAQHVGPLVSMLEKEYYISEPAIRDAIARRTSFNAVHLETMLKVDVFILKARPYDRQALGRRHPDALDPENPSTQFYLCSPEDIILNKLEWYRLGGEQSERQWNDVIGVLKIQWPSLDTVYCRKWAQELRIVDLLEKAFLEADILKS